MLSRRLRWLRDPRAKLALRWCVGLLAVGGLVVYYDPAKLLSALGRTRWDVAAPAIVGLVLVQLIGAATWGVLSRLLSGARLGPWRLVRAYYAAQVAGSVTPAGLGADAVRIYAASGEAGWQGALLPVAMHRIGSVLALLILAMLALVWVPVGEIAGKALLALSSLAALGVLAAWVLFGGGGLWTSLASRVGGRLRLPVAPVAASGRSFWASLTVAVLLAMLFHGVSAALALLLVTAVGGDGGVLPMLGVLMLSRLAILVPFSVSGLGFLEGALAVLFPLVGVEAGVGLAVSLLNRLSLLVTIAVGLVCLLSGGVRLAKRENTAPVAPGHGPVHTG